MMAEGKLGTSLPVYDVHFNFNVQAMIALNVHTGGTLFFAPSKAQRVSIDPLEYRIGRRHLVTYEPGASTSGPKQVCERCGYLWDVACENAPPVAPALRRVFTEDAILRSRAGVAAVDEPLYHPISQRQPRLEDQWSEMLSRQPYTKELANEVVRLAHAGSPCRPLPLVAPAPAPWKAFQGKPAAYPHTLPHLDLECSQCRGLVLPGARLRLLALPLPERRSSACVCLCSSSTERPSRAKSLLATGELALGFWRTPPAPSTEPPTHVEVQVQSTCVDLSTPTISDASTAADASTCEPASTPRGPLPVSELLRLQEDSPSRLRRVFPSEPYEMTSSMELPSPLAEVRSLLEPLEAPGDLDLASVGALKALLDRTPFPILGSALCLYAVVDVPFWDVCVTESCRRSPDPRTDAVLSLVYGVRIMTTSSEVESTLMAFEGREGEWSWDYVDGSEGLIFESVTRLLREYDPVLILSADDAHGMRFLLKRARAAGFQEPEQWRALVDAEDIPRAYLKLKNVKRLEGRVCVSLLETLLAETKLQQATIPAMIREVLGETLPTVSPATLAALWKSPSKHLALTHVMRLVRCLLEAEAKLEVLGRAQAMALMFQSDLCEILVRGSQFKVEALLYRASQAYGYVHLSASQEQVTNMQAAECVPLVLEPLSGFYFEPVAVFDFQSLYPSLVIAYNLCFSTCLGMLVHRKTPPGFRDPPSRVRRRCRVGRFSPDRPTPFGFSQLSVPPVDICEAACGPYSWVLTPDESAFVHPFTRRGMLPAILEEVIGARLLIKSTMKAVKRDPSRFAPYLEGGVSAWLRRQNYRQFALKMVANVSYGYTGASFSGRMPCPEVANAIVQLARVSLERCALKIQEHPEWQCRVVYGDTDSLFVLMPGQTVRGAFALGQTIADVCSSMFPPPVRFLLEKVYCPCWLQTKKRYGGWCHTDESTPPSLESKGLENIRRDHCRLIQRVMSKSLALVAQGASPFFLQQFLRAELVRAAGRVPWPCSPLSVRLDTGDLSEFILFQDSSPGKYAFDRQESEKLHTLPAHAAVLYHRASCTRVQPARERVAFAFSSRPGRLVDKAVAPYYIHSLSKEFEPTKPFYRDGRSVQFDDELRTAGFGHYLDFDSSYYAATALYQPLERMFDMHPVVALREWFTRVRVSFAPPLAWLMELPRPPSIPVALSRKSPSEKGQNMQREASSSIVHFAKVDAAESRPIDSLQGLRDMEEQLLTCRRVCVGCAGSSVVADACVDAFYCPVYSRRQESEGHLLRVRRGQETKMQLQRNI